MSEKISIRLHAALLACAMATVLGLTVWRVPAFSGETAGAGNHLPVMSAFAALPGDFRKDESRVPIRD